MPSHGQEARARQIVEARADHPEDSYDALSPLRGGDLGCSDWIPSPDSMGMDLLINPLVHLVSPVWRQKNIPRNPIIRIKI